MPHLLGDLPTLAGGNVNYFCPSLCSSNCSVYCFLVSSPSCSEFPLMHVHISTQPKMQGNFCKPSELSLSVQFHSILCATRPCKFQVPWPPQTDICLLKRTRSPSYVWFSPSSPHTVTQKLPQGASWDHLRVHLSCFPSLRDHPPVLPSVQ